MADQKASNMAFANLHVHSEYSILDGLAHPRDIARRAKELGQTAVAITDHGNMSGVIPFVDACREEGIKPIVGCELYVTSTSRFDRPKKDDDNFEDSSQIYHLIALAQDQQGYRNLMKLSSTAYLEGYWRKPRVDHELLQRYNEGVFVLSGCLGGELAKAITAGDESRAREVVEFYRTAFPGRYALEIQNHFIDDEEPVRQALIQLSAEYGLPLVATADNHYVYQEQAPLHELWLCMQTGDKLSNPAPPRFKFDGHGYHLASAEEMLALFPEAPEAISNAAMIADTCNLELTSSHVQLPVFPHMDEGATAPQMLRRLCEEGLERRYPGRVTPELKQRLDMELEVINNAGFPDYFLIVWDLVHHAEKSGIKVAPGRGSAAGSIVSYTLGITSVDPIEHNLLFERFLNPERVSMPDIDIDFEDRDSMIEYARSTYGRDKVAQIITISAMGPKDACHRVAKAHGVEYADSLMLTRLIPEGVDTFEDAFRLSPDLAKFVRDNAWTRQIVEDAEKLVGYVSGSSINAAGVVITRNPLLEEIPLQHPSGEAHADAIISQFDLYVLGQLNFLKIDFLGNDSLSVIKNALKMVSDGYGLDIDMDHIPPNDPLTMRMLGSGDTVGVFQMESRSAARILKDIQPTSLGDIAAANALNRPGPLQGVVNPQTGETVVQAYVKRRAGKEEAVAPIPEVQDLLAETHGLILYQDQVMQIANHVAGYSLGEADILRAAMGKKNPEKMAHEKDKFIQGAVKNGVNESSANQLWDYIEKFAGYGFNKAHAYAYGQLAYMTAWVKAHYPIEFITATCNNRGGKFASAKDTAKTQRGTIETAIRDARDHGITVVNPDVNLSEVDFSIRSRARQTISYGLGKVKGVGSAAAEAIVTERKENGPYKSFVELVERNQVQYLSLAAVRAIWKKAKTAPDFMTLEEMVDAGIVKGEAIEVAQSAIAEREANGPYKSFAQVLERNGLRTGTNQATWDALIRSGACDEFGSRHDLLAALPEVLKAVNKMKTSDAVQLQPFVEEERRRQLSRSSSGKMLTIKDLDDEESLLGLPLSGHRMDVYQQEIAQRGIMTMDAVLGASTLPPRFRVAGIIKSKRFTRTKKDNKPMAIIKLEDSTGDFDVMVFENNLDELRTVLDSGSGPLLVRGYRMSGRNPEENQDHLTVVAQQVERLEEVAPPSLSNGEEPYLEVEMVAPVEMAMMLN